MSLLAGSVVAKFQADLQGLKSGVAEAQTSISGLKDKASQMGESVKASFDSFMNAAKIAGAVAAGAFTLFAKSSMDLKAETDKAIISLDIIAERFKQNGKQAGELAVTLGKDLRIGTGAAADAMQNLIKSGLNIDQASDLLKRFTNEAMTGKSESISLADAVKNLSFAYATGNSALGNMSGISENWSNITEKGKAVLEGWNGTANESKGITVELAGQIKQYEASLKAQGKTLSSSDDEMAKYVGLLQLTNLTQGSAARFQGTFTDNIALMTNKVNDVKLALGGLLQSALNPLVQWFTNSGILEFATRFTTAMGGVGDIIKAIIAGTQDQSELEEFFSLFTNGEFNSTTTMLADTFTWLVNAFKSLGDWIAANKELVLTFLKGLAIALGALLVIGTIIGLLNMLFNPITLIVLAVAALFTAWQTNFWGIRDLVDGVVIFIQGLFTQFVAWWQANQEWILQIARGVWEIIQGVFKVAFALIGGLLKVFGQVMMGDWKGALETVKATAQSVWEGIKQIISGVLDVIIGNIKRFAGDMIGQLEGLWNKAKEIGANIKDALSQISPFHHNSPSLVEYVQMGTGVIKDTYAGLENSLAGMDFKSHLMTMVDGMQFTPAVDVAGARIINQNINATLTDGLDVQTLAEELAFKYRNENLW